MCSVPQFYTIQLVADGARNGILTFRLEESAFPDSMAMLDFVIICSINLEQEAWSMVPSSSDAGNVEM